MSAHTQIAAVVRDGINIITMPSSSYDLPGLSSPTSTADAINKIAFLIVDGVFILAGTAAVAGAMWGGYQIIRGGENIARGKQSIAYSLIGLLVIALSYTIVQIVINIDPVDPNVQNEEQLVGEEEAPSFFEQTEPPAGGGDDGGGDESGG